jgi:hypothetical protein
MKIKAFAEYVMRGQKEAMSVAAPLACIPILSSVAVVIMVLVTLRNGIKEGACLLVAISLPALILSWFAGPLMLVYQVLLGNVMVWLLAAILRVTESWNSILWFSVILGVIALCFIQCFMPDTLAQWNALLQKKWMAYSQTTGLPASQKEQMLFLWQHWFLPMGMGIQTVVVLFSNLLNCAAGRWLQSLLYYPEGFKQELYALKLNQNGILLLLTLTAVALWWKTGGLEILPVLLFFPMCVGISIVHALMAKRATTPLQRYFFLIWFYVSLILFIPYMTVLLCFTAIFDSWFHFRVRPSN